MKIYGSNKGTAAQKLVELLPKMKERMPDLEPYLLAAVVTFQGNTNAPIITEFQRTLNDCIEHPEQVLNIVQFWNAIRWTVYDWCFEKTNYPLAVNLMEGERRVAAGGKVDFNNQEKIKLGYAYVVTERWQDALNLFESCSNQPVMMNGKGPWGCAFMPVLTDEAADYCRKKLGLEVAQDPRKFDMGEPLFCLCTPSAFAVEENGLWIAIGGQLLHLNFDLKTNLVVTLPVDSDTPISCMSLGSSNIWIGTYGQGLIEFDKASHQIRHLTGKDGLMMDDIASLRLAESTLWIGYGKRTYTYTGQGYSLGGGLGRLDLSTHQFTSYTLSLSDGPEVHRQTGGNIVPEASDKPTRRPVIAMAGGLAGDVWFVAENDPTRLHRYQARNNSWEATLWNCSSLASDNSRLFVGHYGSATGPLGVSVLDLKSNHWHELTAIGGLTPNAVSTFALDGRNLWVGGLGYIALLDVDQDKTIKFAHIKSSAVDRIQIAGGYVWAQFDWHLYRVPLSAVK